MTNTSTRRGFTLIELVIAVLIIGILAAVAVPMYKHAMIKSRFSTVMPVAKTIADAQESYYLRNGQYASDQEALDVTPANAENTTIELSGTDEEEDENYAYVVASRSDVPGARYIQYQKNSPKFASNIHCEALTGEEEPNWLCKALGGEYIGENGDYTAYLLSGDSTAGTFIKECKGAQDSTEQTCECGGSISREVTCNTTTGEWEYGEWDGTCPDKPDPQEETCGTGTKTRSATCKADGSGWELGEWDISGCQLECPTTKPATSRSCSDSGTTLLCGTQTRTVGECNHTTGKWEVGPWQGACPQVESLYETGCYFSLYVCENNSRTFKSRRRVDATTRFTYQMDSNCPSGCSRTQINMICQGGSWIDFSSSTECLSETLCSYPFEGMITD